MRQSQQVIYARGVFNGCNFHNGNTVEIDSHIGKISRGRI